MVAVVDGIAIRFPEEERPGILVIRVDGTFRSLDDA